MLQSYKRNKYRNHEEMHKHQIIHILYSMQHKYNNALKYKGTGRQAEASQCSGLFFWRGLPTRRGWWKSTWNMLTTHHTLYVWWFSTTFHGMIWKHPEKHTFYNHGCLVQARIIFAIDSPRKRVIVIKYAYCFNLPLTIDSLKGHW